MQVYNVEVFHRDFSFVHNYTVEDITYKYDYLTPVENEVMMSYNANVKMGDYIVIRSDERHYDGVVSGIEVLTKDFMKVKYKPLTNIFNTTIYVDYRNQDPSSSNPPKSIEQIIYENIKYIFIDGYPPLPWEIEEYTGFTYDVDNLQKVPGLVVTKKSDTTVWQLGLEMSSNWGQYQYFSEVNLADYVIPRALKSVGVMVSMRLDIENQKIYCDIERLSATSLTIEADLPQILQKNINVVDTMEMPNKAIYLPYPPDPMAQVTIYYRHSDGKWDTNNTDRLTPVILHSEAASSTQYPTLEAELFDKYGAVLYANLIELTTSYGTYEIEVGNTASIISEDNQYESMLTGYEIHGDIIKYIFGMIRLDLTKILKRRL